MENHRILKNMPLKVLILEDSLLDLELITGQLSTAGYQLEVTHAEEETGFREALKKKKYDIILSDFKLPGFDAFGALEICQEICPEVPFICVSGSIGEEKAIELLKQGAVDYVLKDRPERLPFAIQRALDKAKEGAALLKAEEKLLLLNRAVEASSVSVVITDAKGSINYVNPYFKELTGYSYKEVLGKNPRFQKSGNQPKTFYEELWNTILSGKDWTGEFQNRKKNGELYWENGVISPIINSDGVVTNFVAIKEDISERKRIIDELDAAKVKAEESDKLKTAFINNISHEIRTPLNGILGFGQILAGSELTAEKRVQLLEYVQESSDRLMNTVSDYMDMAMIVSGTMIVQKREFSLEPIYKDITEKAEKVCAEKSIDFRCKIPDSAHLTINSDPELIRKILDKLLDNAIKFTRKGSITCGFGIKPGYIEFFVRDTGIGIKSNKLDLIFELFGQEDTSMVRGYEGSGLGLNIAKGLLTLLGGEIRVTSEKGKGSEFIFTLPCNGSEKPVSIDALKKNKTINKVKPLILIAEDDKLNYVYMAAVLDLMDYKHIHAVNGAEAVNYCRQNSEISIVLMDIKMPVMNGIEATRQIREFRPEIPIIAITAYAQTGDEHRFLAAGCNGYVAKPIDKEKLLSLIRKYSE